MRQYFSKQNRALLSELVRTDFKLRYQGSALLAQTVKAFDELRLPSGRAQGQSYDNDKKFSATVSAVRPVSSSARRTAAMS